jgi:hypothetical protein
MSSKGLKNRTSAKLRRRRRRRRRRKKNKIENKESRSR